jgi:hypothetical protein
LQILVTVQHFQNVWLAYFKKKMHGHYAKNVGHECIPRMHEIARFIV